MKGWVEGMGLPQPLGPYAVAFADFELRRTEGVHGGVSTASVLQHNSPDFVMLADAQGAPLIRIFYPTSHAHQNSAPLDSSSRWMPSIMYTWGYISKLIRPSSAFHRLAIWILTGLCPSAYGDLALFLIFLSSQMGIFIWRSFRSCSLLHVAWCTNTGICGKSNVASS